MQARACIAFAFAAVLLLSGCATGVAMGDAGAKTVATGGAAGAAATNANSQLERCEQTLGTLAIVEESSQPWFHQFTAQFRTASTVPLLRMIVQQSNCFVIVERGQAFTNMQVERDLIESGELRKTNNLGKGQMVAADFTATPSVNFSERGTSGVNGIGGGRAGVIASLIAGSIKSNEASTTLLLTDNRSGVQIAAAEGSAKNWDFGMLALFANGGGGGGSGFSKTPQGKVLTAAFMDSYNQMVRALRHYKAQSVEGGLGNGGTLKVN